MAEADVLVRAFDQSRHVANREPVKVGVFHDADLRMQRGERIRRDFRARLGNGREQRGLAGVRITDQADLGHDAQFEEKIAFPARLARLRETRRLARGGGEIAIAQTAAPAFAQNKLLAVFGEVGDQFAFCRFAGGMSPAPSLLKSISCASAPLALRINGRLPVLVLNIGLFILVSHPRPSWFRWAAWCPRAARRACRREP